MPQPWFDLSHPRYLALPNPVQAAIDDAVAANGGVVHIPRPFTLPLLLGTVTVPYAPGDPINTLGHITLLGDSPQTSQIAKAGGSDYDVLRIERSNVTVRNLTVNGGLSAFGTNRGIVLGHLSGSGSIRNVTIADCIVRGTASHALHVTGGVGAPNSQQNRFVRCDFAQNTFDSLVRIDEGNTDQFFDTCALHWYRNTALELRSCQGVRCHDCTFENPQDADGTLPYVLGNLSHNCEFIGCWFEEQDIATVAKWFVDLFGCNAWALHACHFVRMIGTAPKALRIGDPAAGGQCLGIVIVNPRLVLFNDGAHDALGHIELRNPATECTLIGGYYVVGKNTKTSMVLDMTDPTAKSTWLSNRRWRLPQLTDAESPTTGRHLADVLPRSNRGLEAWNAHGSEPSWIPLPVNRYANQAALDAVPASSKNRGTMAWVDDLGVVKVWNGTTWKQLVFVP